MKILFFNVSAAEADLIAEWSANHHIFVQTTSESLRIETMKMTATFDAIVFYPGQQFQTDARLYQQLARNGVQCLSIKSTGYDNINLTYAKQYQLTVTNVPNYSPESVAHFTIMSILMLLRQLPQYLDSKITVPLKQGIGTELTEVTVGLYGAGRLGSLVARTLHFMGARVIFNARTPKPALTALGIAQVDFETLLHESDVLSIHVPLTDLTFHQFDYATLAKMPDHAMLINTARGGIVDTSALITHLTAGKFQGVVLDALENEDTQGFEMNPYYQTLHAFGRVLLTPHIAYHTSAAVRDIVLTALENARETVKSGTSANIVLN